MFRKWKNVAWLALGLVIAPLASEAKPKTPRTVLDYFDLLPKHFFEVEYSGSNTNRRKWLREGFNPDIPANNRSIIDLKNDFLRFPGDGAQGRLDIAVFRCKGQATIGVHNNFEEGDLSFWRYRNGKFIEVTKQVVPVGFNSRNGYAMPRLGTTIRVFKSSFWFRFKPGMKPLYTLRWRGGRFHRQR